MFSHRERVKHVVCDPEDRLRTCAGAGCVVRKRVTIGADRIRAERLWGPHAPSGRSRRSSPCCTPTPAPEAASTTRRRIEPSRQLATAGPSVGEGPAEKVRKRGHPSQLRDRLIECGASLSSDDWSHRGPVMTAWTALRTRFGGEKNPRESWRGAGSHAARDARIARSNRAT